MNSKDLVKQILLCFSQGRGFVLPNAITYGNHNEYQQEFRNKLSYQIENLTGTKPRIEYDSNERKYVVYQS